MIVEFASGCLKGRSRWLLKGMTVALTVVNVCCVLHVQYVRCIVMVWWVYMYGDGFDED